MSPPGSRPVALVPLLEARTRVTADRAPLAPIRLPLAEAHGAILAAPVRAAHDVPPFANSAMDGFALRARDTAGAPRELRVVGALMAGAAFSGALAPGESLRIMTGAPVPEGADAVCMIERATVSGDRVMVSYELAPGENVRLAGGDVRAGDEVLRPGEVLTPGALALVASVGVDALEVVPRPRVGVLSTGDELVVGDGALLPGQIHESNRVALLALAAEAGATPVDLGVAPDDEAQVTKILLDAAERCDAILTSGGVSVGDRDVLKAVLDELSGGSMVAMQVAIRPAKPFAFGSIGTRRVPVFGLPGNPVSAIVSFELFARPVLRAMGGHDRTERPLVAAAAPDGFSRRADGKVHFVRVRARVEDDGFVVRGAGGQESHHLHAMARANALAVLPDGEGVEPGGTVHAMILDDSAFAGSARLDEVVS